MAICCWSCLLKTQSQSCHFFLPHHSVTYLCQHSKDCIEELHRIALRSCLSVSHSWLKALPEHVHTPRLGPQLLWPAIDSFQKPISELKSWKKNPPISYLQFLWDPTVLYIFIITLILPYLIVKHSFFVKCLQEEDLLFHNKSPENVKMPYTKHGIGLNAEFQLTFRVVRANRFCSQLLFLTLAFIFPFPV